MYIILTSNIIFIKTKLYYPSNGELYINDKVVFKH